MKHFSKDDISKTIDFCFHALGSIGNEERVGGKAGQAPPGDNVTAADRAKFQAQFVERLSAEDMKVLSGLRILGKAISSDLEGFENSEIDGLKARLERGNLGLLNRVDLRCS